MFGCVNVFFELVCCIRSFFLGSFFGLFILFFAVLHSSFLLCQCYDKASVFQFLKSIHRNRTVFHVFKS